MEIAVKFRVRETPTGWTYDLWSHRTGWLLDCGGSDLSEATANHNAPVAADMLAADLQA